MHIKIKLNKSIQKNNKNALLLWDGVISEDAINAIISIIRKYFHVLSRQV